MRPTQRFFNLKQLSMTPANAFAVPVQCNKKQVNTAAFVKTATGESALHIVNNGAACEAQVTGLPWESTTAVCYVTNSSSHAEARLLTVKEGKVTLQLPAESFVTLIAQ